MRNRSPRLLAAFATGALVVALAACGGDDASSGDETTEPPATTAAAATTAASAASTAVVPTTASATTAPEDDIDLSGVTLRVGEIQGYNRDLLTAAGAFDDVPYEVEYSTIRGGAAIFQALSSDQIDVSFQGVDPALFSAAGAGVPFKIVGVHGKNPAKPEVDHGTFWLAAGPGVAADGPEDLVGKTVGVSPGEASTPHYFLAKALEDSGVSIDDVNVVFLDSAGGLAALLSGQIDAWSGGGPLFTQVQAAGGTLLGWSSEHTDNFIIATASDQALADPATSAAIGDLYSRVIRQYIWSNANKEEYATTLTELTPLEYDTALAGANAELALRPFPLDAALIARLQAEADLTFKYGLTDSEVDVTTILDNRFDEIVAEYGPE